MPRVLEEGYGEATTPPHFDGGLLQYLENDGINVRHEDTIIEYLGNPQRPFEHFAQAHGNASVQRHPQDSGTAHLEDLDASFLGDRHLSTATTSWVHSDAGESLYQGEGRMSRQSTLGSGLYNSAINPLLLQKGQSQRTSDFRSTSESVKRTLGSTISDGDTAESSKSSSSSPPSKRIKNGYPCLHPGCGKEFDIPCDLKYVSVQVTSSTKYKPNANTRCSHHMKNPSHVSLDQRKWPCHESECQQAFVDEKSLKRHMTTHSQLKGFPCSLTGCNKSYKRLDHLQRHIKCAHPQT